MYELERPRRPCLSTFLATKEDPNEYLIIQLKRLLGRGKVLSPPIQLSWKTLCSRSGINMLNVDGVFFVPDARNISPDAIDFRHLMDQIRDTGHLVVLDAIHSPTKLHVDTRMREMATMWDETLQQVYQKKRQDLELMPGSTPKWVDMVEALWIRHKEFSDFVTVVFGYKHADPLVLEYIKLINGGSGPLDHQAYDTLVVRMVRNSPEFAEICSAPDLDDAARKQLNQLMDPTCIKVNVWKSILMRGKLARQTTTRRHCRRLVKFYLHSYNRLAPLFSRFQGHLAHLNEKGAYVGPDL